MTINLKKIVNVSVDTCSFYLQFLLTEFAIIFSIVFKQH